MKNWRANFHSRVNFHFNSQPFKQQIHSNLSGLNVHHVLISFRSLLILWNFNWRSNVHHSEFLNSFTCNMHTHLAATQIFHFWCHADISTSWTLDVFPLPLIDIVMLTGKCPRGHNSKQSTIHTATSSESQTSLHWILWWTNQPSACQFQSSLRWKDVEQSN